MNLYELIQSTQTINAIDRETIQEIEVAAIEMDSRQVNNGALFICMEGLTVDGHDYAGLAVDQGAKAIVAEKQVDVDVPVILVPSAVHALADLANAFYGYPSESMNVIGITGTNGKTTLTYLLDAIFSEAGQKTAVIGTIDMKIGDKRIPVENTTPDALFLHRHLHLMREENVDTVIMEVSSHALKQGRVLGIEFDDAVFTNLSQDHLDYHPHMDDYAYAKSLLFAQLGQSVQGKAKSAVINIDDSYSDVMMRSTAQSIISYSLEQSAVIQVEDYELSPHGLSFVVKTPLGDIPITTKMSGKFNIYNILAAIGVAYQHELSLEVIKSAIEQLQGVPGRFELVDANQNYTVVIDYAHTPDSLLNVLQTIEELKQGRVVTIVGCGGDRDRSKRPKMADAAIAYSDEVIFTSDNPRTEDPHAILEDMTNHLDESNYFKIIESRRDAIKAAIDNAGERDMILIAGKGHETYQDVAGERHHFDDREVARELILARQKS
ncbi:UDP-N-acetylmuramoyl-L-alanyl-D-glutamate--2,6-diaminopimelate ligase [Alkalibacillus sp. S2W]|uniref:UDP-N-acetylmuramoyl-L-alanyl-D-glutamate--2, 6-diaminopimelate ligase n=1 Tax=Alkalibacillus sp. S2W TaxID=3386553 RepID=UPI00398C8E2E